MACGVSGTTGQLAPRAVEEASEQGPEAVTAQPPCMEDPPAQAEAA